MMKAKVFRTLEKTGERWAERPELEFKGRYDANRPVITINTDQKHQEHMGFGGSFTEAAAYTFNLMSKQQQEEFITAYFDKEKGLGYTLGRVHIHSCDFALGNYTYIDEGDESLESFDMSHEDQWVVPMIKQATEKAGEELTLLASPWSPPAFMKNTNEMNYGGYLLPEYMQSWANYYVKYIEGMKERGIDIWGVSVQNEPLADQCWDSCIYTAEDERDFVKNYLGPTMHSAGLEDKAIVVWDHNRDVIVERAAVVLSDPEAAKYVWGVGNHWYVSEAFENLSTVHSLFPDKHLLFTEGCVELTDTSVDKDEKSGYMGAWGNGERYGRNIIGDFNNWSRGWIDWNLLLNEEGGPNHVDNFCEAPIMFDREKKELIYNNSYYYIGHFSRYIDVGAKRLTTIVSCDQVSACTFENLDGSIVVVVQNEGWIQNLAFVIDGVGVDITLPNNSITTYVISKNA